MSEHILHRALKVFAILLMCSSGISAQNNTHSLPGIPFLQTFTPEEYGGSTQNWDIVQDSLGLIYIANGRGLLIYNGERFRLVKMPNGNSVRSIAIDQKNRIYCGGPGYFGYLTYSPSGQVHFVDLCQNQSDSEVQSFSTIENIYCTDKGVFFRSQEKIFQYDQDRQLTSVSAEEHSFLETFWVRDRLFTNRRNLGIQVLTDSNTFRPLHDEGVLKGEIVTTILPHSRGFLIGSSEDLFLWEENRLTDFESAADEFVSQARLYNGRLLNDHTYVLSTLNKGMLIINEEGDILLQSDR